MITVEITLRIPYFFTQDLDQRLRSILIRIKTAQIQFTMYSTVRIANAGRSMIRSHKRKIGNPAHSYRQGIGIAGIAAGKHERLRSRCDNIFVG